MNGQGAVILESTIRQYCKNLRLPTIGSQFLRLADEAVKARTNHAGYLEALLAAELEERERRPVQRRLMEAHLPRLSFRHALTILSDGAFKLFVQICLEADRRAGRHET